jgi:ribosomal protein S1
MYHIGQLVEGTVSRVEPFGAFVSLEPGIEALLHVSQISDDKTVDPRRELYEAQRVLTRVISIEADKQRLGLSLKEVTAAEKDQWQQAKAEANGAAVEAAELAAELAEIEVPNAEGDDAVDAEEAPASQS